MRTRWIFFLILVGIGCVALALYVSHEIETIPVAMQSAAIATSTPQASTSTSPVIAAATTNILMPELPAHVPVGTYIWDSPRTLTNTQINNDIQFMSAQGFTTLYISIDEYLDIHEMPAGTTQTTEMKAFQTKLAYLVQQASAHHIQVVGLAGDPLQANDDDEYIPPEILSFVISYNAAHPSNQQLAGIVYDIEFQNQKDFATLNAGNALSISFLNLANTLATQVQSQSPNLILGFHVAYNFDSDAVVPLVDWHGTTAPLTFHLMDILNTIAHGQVIVMDYRNTATGPNGSIALVQSEFTYNTNTAGHTQIIIGQETGPFDPPSITFLHLKPSALTSALTSLTAAFSSQKTFAGFAIDDLPNYQKFVTQGS